jgi:hypothetical protein
MVRRGEITDSISVIALLAVDAQGRFPFPEKATEPA